MKFLIQTVDDEIEDDFSFTLIQHIKAHMWNKRPIDDDMEYVLSDTHAIAYKTFNQKFEYIPIGSVEFVSDYLKYFFNLTPAPRNIPVSLRGFETVGRKVFEIDSYDGKDNMGNILKHLPNGKTNVFVKSAEKIKAFEPEIIPAWYEDYTDQKVPKNHKILCSEVVTFQTEWRGFVHRHNLLDIRNYSGDPFLMPDVKKVRQMMGKFDDAPVAYTIDVGVLENGETVLVEIHDFFSCGLYGFDHYKLPWMFSQWYYDFIKHEKKDLVILK